MKNTDRKGMYETLYLWKCVEIADMRRKNTDRKSVYEAIYL